MNRTICPRYTRDSNTSFLPETINNTTTAILNRLDSSSTTSMFTRPKVDMILRDGKYLVSVETPGVRQEDITLEACGRSLVVKAKYRDYGAELNDSIFLDERVRNDICRYIYMPFNADLTKVEMARYKDGVLHVQVPELFYSRTDNRSIPIRSI